LAQTRLLKAAQAFGLIAQFNDAVGRATNDRIGPRLAPNWRPPARQIFLLLREQPTLRELSVPIWEGAGFLGMSPGVLQDAHGHPDLLQGAATAIGQKGRYVSVAETVVNLTEGRNQAKNPNEILVGVAGFEPATPASRTQCSTGLSHTPTRTRLIALGFALRKKPN
jgi:hypothetical protein